MKKIIIWAAIVSLSILVSVISSSYVMSILLEKEEVRLSKRYNYDYHFDIESNARFVYDYAELTRQGDKDLIYKLSCMLLRSNNKHIDPSIYNDHPTRKMRLEEFLKKSEKMVTELKSDGYCD